MGCGRATSPRALIVETELVLNLEISHCFDRPVLWITRAKRKKCLTHVEAFCGRPKLRFRIETEYVRGPLEQGEDEHRLVLIARA